MAATEPARTEISPDTHSPLRRLVSPMRELERNPIHRAAPRAGGRALPALAVIGAGRAGGSIAGAAAAAGLDVRLAGRAEAREACGAAEAVLLCVPDQEIGAAAEAAAAGTPVPLFVGHTSGALGLDALAPARSAGAAVFGLHPLQTLPDDHADLSGAACAVSGSNEAALALATTLAERLGMKPFAVADADRAAYHAAASLASNFLVTLEESASTLLASSGIEQPRELLGPLVERTAATWRARGREALTGPIARGDEATVERHRRALEERAPELLPLYDELAARTRELAGEPVG